MEHFLNCHGEFALALYVILNIPVIGYSLRALIGHGHVEGK